jgi:hypothetical protein
MKPKVKDGCEEVKSEECAMIHSFMLIWAVGAPHHTFFPNFQQAS